MLSVQYISGSGVTSISVGSDFRKTYLVVGIDVVSGTWTLLRKVGGQPNGVVTAYTNLLNGVVQNTAITGSTQIIVENSASEIFLSSSVAGIATASLAIVGN